MPLAHGCSLASNPARDENKYAHDALLLMPADIKTIATEFRTADRYGIDPARAITLNQKDVRRYESEYPVFAIVFNIVIPGRESRRIALLSDIQKAIRHGMAKLHYYQQRKKDDQGNAKCSYVLDENWFRKV